jgi:hypothetical protein
MKALTRFALVLVALALARPPAQALPDAAATAGRLILRHYADAVVTVKATVILKITVEGRFVPPQENKIDIAGTVIAPTGLTVTSLSSIDPKVLFESIRAKLMGGGAGVQLSQSETNDLKLRLGDGTEVPAKIVWRDADRDLAFIAPTGAGGRTFACVNLAEAPAAAVVLGDYYELARLPEGLLRTPVVRSSTIIGIIERPRRMFLISTEGLGCPIFDPQGHVLGVSLYFVVKGLPSGNVVVPAGDIAESASQISQL